MDSETPRTTDKTERLRSGKHHLSDRAQTDALAIILGIIVIILILISAGVV